MVMRRDYTFWGLDELNLEPCCALKFYPEMQNCVIQTDMDTEEKIKEDEMLATEDFGEGKLAKIRYDTLKAIHRVSNDFVDPIYGIF